MDHTRRGMKLSLLLAAGASAFALDARFGDRDVAKTPTLGAFCAKMTDSMYENGAANPTQKIAYDLCLDTSKASWSRTETDGSKHHRGAQRALENYAFEKFKLLLLNSNYFY